MLGQDAATSAATSRGSDSVARQAGSESPHPVREGALNLSPSFQNDRSSAARLGELLKRRYFALVG